MLSNACRRLFTYRNCGEQPVVFPGGITLHSGDVLQIVSVHPPIIADGIEYEWRLAEDWERGHKVTRAAEIA